MSSLLDELQRHLAPAPGMRYLPNKLHGDEIVKKVDGGSEIVYDEPVGAERIDLVELDVLLAEQPKHPAILVDDTQQQPPLIFDFKRPVGRIWSKDDLRALYMPPTGYIDTTLGYALAAQMWHTKDHRPLLVFRIQC